MMRLASRVAAALFGFVSGVLRNARTFHPDGRTFLGTVISETSDSSLSRAGRMLEGHVLMRIGMGIVKQHAPRWVRNRVPDAPSVAVRFSPSPNGNGMSVRQRGRDELDILFTAGGDRLWKLIGNLATGGRCYGLNQFDYFKNRYFADVPFRIPDCGLNVWLRLNPESGPGKVDANRRSNAEAREHALTEAASRGAVFTIEAQSAADVDAPFIPLAKIRFDREIEIDQEALRFQPTAGRGFEPYGTLTSLREEVYPASAHARPPNRADREVRDRRGFIFRLFHRSEGAETSETRVTRPRPFTFKRIASAIGLLFAAVVIVASAYGAWRFMPDKPLTNPDESAGHSQVYIDEQRFKYGSTGGEANLGFPFLMWQAAPLVCAETLKKVVGDQIAADFVTRVRAYTARANGGPDEARQGLSREGYTAFGIIYEKENGGQEKNIPVGVSMRRNLGLERVFVNCAFCHSSTVRVSAESEPRLVLGMPANLLDIRNFEDFLFRCTTGPQFSKEKLIAEIENMNGPLSLLDRYLIYPLAIWIIRDRVQFLSSRLGFFAKQPDWGPGRVDTFSNAKGIFNWPWEKLPNWHTDGWVEKDQIGTVDFPSIWLQGPRKKRADNCPMELHWDGNNDAVEERDLSAAFGTGALPTNIDHKNLGKIEKWLLSEQNRPPKFAEFFPEKFQLDLAKKGAEIYAKNCADCHGAAGDDFTGKYVGEVTPIKDINTDRHRLDNYTEGLATIQAMLYAGEKKSSPAPARPPQAMPAKCDPFVHGGAQENSYRFKRFRKTYGYANTPLDGIWLRAPYLHNGSIPTLRALLNPAEKPKVYFRGNDEYDPEAMGFKWESSRRADGRAYFRYNTEEAGNSNKGHEGERYGTDLPEGDKSALIEYLKTF